MGLLPSCAGINKQAFPALGVKLPVICERILAQVSLPAVTADQDARVAFIQENAALLIALRENAAARSCLADLRKRYAAKPKRWG